MRVLVVVDMQNDFIDGSLGTPEAVAIVPHVKAKINEYKDRGDLIIYTKDTHSENYLNTPEGEKLPVRHCIKGTVGHEIPNEILFSDCPVIEKPTFGSLELIKYLDSLNFDSLEFVGLCTDICVISNALMAKAHFYEKPITVDSSCCAGVTPKSHTEALNTMRMCQIDVI